MKTVKALITETTVVDKKNVTAGTVCEISEESFRQLRDIKKAVEYKEPATPTPVEELIYQKIEREAEFLRQRRTRRQN